MTIEERAAALPLLQHVNAAVLNRHIVSKEIYTACYSKGATIHHQYEPCKTLDIVLSGKLVAYALAENGSAKTMFEFTEKSIIGANLLFGDNHAYPLNIFSMSACELLHITQPAIMDFLHEYDFVIEFVKSLSQNSQGLNQKMTMVIHKNLRENILDYFQQQVIIQKSSSITLPISKKELADYFGVQRPSLFRELKRLQEEKKITINNRCIIIHTNPSDT